MGVTLERNADTANSPLPEGWDVASLLSLCRSISDGTHFTPRYVDEGVPFYSVENVSADNFTDTKFISRAEHQSLVKRCKPERGDILMTRIGSLGDTKLIDWDVNASIYVSLALLKPGDYIDGAYLYWYTRSLSFVRDVEKRSLLNATPKKINMGDIGQIPIPFPKSRSEQRAIATALSDISGFIDSLAALIAKKRLVKQGAMQELLTGKRRLDGFAANRGYKQTDVGLIPADWRVATLGEIANIKTGGRNNEDKVDDAEYPFFVRSPKVERIDRFSHDCEAILVPGEGNIGNIFHYVNGRFNVHQRVYAVTRFHAGIAPKFLYYYLATYFGLHAMKNSVKATVDSLRLPTFQQFQVALPSTLAEQTAIATVLADMDDEIRELDLKLQKVRDVMQGMMQNLLTGKVRLV